MKRLAILSVLILCSCDSAVQTTIEGDTKYTQTRVSCTYASFCFAPGIDSNGKMTYEYRFYPACPGTAEATEADTPVKVLHKSGKITHEIQIEYSNQGGCI